MCCNTRDSREKSKKAIIEVRHDRIMSYDVPAQGRVTDRGNPQSVKLTGRVGVSERRNNCLCNLQKAQRRSYTSFYVICIKRGKRRDEEDEVCFRSIFT